MKLFTMMFYMHRVLDVLIFNAAKEDVVYLFQFWRSQPMGMNASPPALKVCVRGDS